MKLILAILLSCLNVVYSYSETSLWKISNGSNILYLGGTVHILRESDYPLPEAFTNAFEKSKIIIFENPFDSLEAYHGKKYTKIAEVANQIEELYNNSKNIKSLVDLTQNLIVMTHNNAKVYGLINGSITGEQLAKDDPEIFKQLSILYQNIQTLSENEDCKLYLNLINSMMADEESKIFISTYMSPDLKSLKSILNDEMFKKVQFLCDKYSIPLSDIVFFNPKYVSDILFSSIVGQFCTADGVDAFFKKKADEYGKQIEYLEHDEVASPIFNSGNEYGDLFYEYLFSGLDEDELKKSMDTIINDWEKGINDGFDFNYERENFPVYYEALIKDRNNAWMPIIENYLKKSAGVLVLVGYGHMYGPDGLLTQLSKKGYAIEQQ